MKELEQRIAIAKTRGYTNFKVVPHRALKADSPSGEKGVIVPNYLTNLNAICEVVGTLNDLQQIEYIQTLVDIVCPDTYGIANLYKSTFKVAQATASQKSKAYLRTLGTIK